MQFLDALYMAVNSAKFEKKSGVIRRVGPCLRAVTSFSMSPFRWSDNFLLAISDNDLNDIFDKHESW